MTDPAPPTLAALVRAGTLDAELAALLWLLVEGGVPLVVTGEADVGERARVAGAVLGVDPGRAFVLLDVDADPVGIDGIAAILQGGVGLGLTLQASALGEVLERLSAPPLALPADAVRRLGAVLVLEATPAGPRVVAAHYLRPTERDGQGHVQRRPPAVLAIWDATAGTFEHFAWGIGPELADRLDRSDADLETRLALRAGLLAGLSAGGILAPAAHAAAVTRHLATEPRRQPAPARESARPSSFRGGLTDPHVH